MLYVWYPEYRKDWDTIHEENDVIEMREELSSAKKQLKQGKGGFPVMADTTRNHIFSKEINQVIIAAMILAPNFY